MNYTQTFEAPAKINIGLHVLFKRKDSYHNIETIFYPVKLQDKLIVKVTSHKESFSQIIFKTNLEDLNFNSNNLCLLAAEYFLNDFRIYDGYKISITLIKRIPIGGGLGGGSSDAAAVLLALASAFKLKEKEKKKLPQIALKIGSDVPYFLLNEPAYASSRGEKLTPLPRFKIDYDILIVNPGIHISTPWAYKKLNVTKERPKSLNRIKIYSEKYNDILSNDFEKMVFKKYPEIKNIKKMMKDFGAVYTSMSGSGSTIFGFFRGKSINEAAKYFKGKGYFTFKSKSSH